MANAERDDNFVPTLLAVSSTDGTTPVTVYANPTTHRLLTSASTLSGPISSTDNAIAVWDGATGLVIQNSVVTIDPSTGEFSGISNIPYITSGTSAPASTPGKIGDIYIKTDTAKVYISTGTSSSSDWTIIN